MTGIMISDAYDNVYDLIWLGSVVYRLRLDDACCACIVLEFDLGSLEWPAYQGPADGKRKTVERQCYVMPFVQAGHWETEVVCTAKLRENGSAQLRPVYSS